MIQYTILNQDTESPLIQRILANRNIDCDINDFYHPTFSKYRLDPFLLSDMDKAITKIQSAIKSNHKIMIFGDYDVDGITSSWSLYTFFQHYL